MASTHYYMNLALTTQEASSCTRRHVGCIIINEGRVVSTGYNFHPRKCDNDDVCLRRMLADDRGEPVKSNTSLEEGACIHAEMNALLFADYKDIVGSKVFVTHPPCPMCTRLLIQGQVKEVHYIGSLDPSCRHLIDFLLPSTRFHRWGIQDGVPRWISLYVPASYQD